MAPLLKHRHRDQVGHSSCVYSPHRHTQRNSLVPFAATPMPENVTEIRLKKRLCCPQSILRQTTDQSTYHKNDDDRLQALYDEAYTELKKSIDSYNNSFVAHMRSLEAMPNRDILAQDSQCPTEDRSIKDLTDRLAAGSIKDYSPLIEHGLKQDPQIGFEEEGACGDLW
ncbi:hypothetical protein J3Q64DRAFT_1754111 [Phycomyces blakesleeanus]